MAHFNFKVKTKLYFSILSLVMITTMLACSLSDSIIKNAISSTQAAQPTAPQIEQPASAATPLPTAVPTFTPVTAAIAPETSLATATETPPSVVVEPEANTLSEALVQIDQLVAYFDENFKVGSPDYEPLGLGNDCQVDCAGRWISGIYDTFDLIIELNQESSEENARAAVEELQDLFVASEYTQYPLINWDEYGLPTSWESILPDNYYSAHRNLEEMDEAIAVSSYGPVIIYITMLDYEMGWAEYPNILLQMVTTLQTQNLMNMQFE